MTPPVTVAVVSWNTRDLLERCLRSLAADAEAGRAAVWVCDNASSDGSPEMVKERFGWVSLVRAGENLGYGRAVNEVARRTESPWLAAANADVELARGALETLVATGEADPRAGIVAPRLITLGGLAQHSVHPFPDLRMSVVLALGVPSLRPELGDRLCLEGYWDDERPRYVDWAHGAFLLVRRGAFDEAGGFDPSQWMYAEDLDLAWRLRRRGWLTRFEPRAMVRHAVAAATGEAFGAEREARHMRAAYRWLARRRGRPVTGAYAFVNVAGAGARWAALTPLAAVAPGRFAAPRRRAARWTRLHVAGVRGVLGSADRAD